MKYHKKGVKGLFISTEALEHITKRGGSNLVKALFWHLKDAERQYCNRQKDYFSQSDQQIMGTMNIASKKVITRLKRELVALGLAETWQEKLPASRSGRKFQRRATPHITNYKLFY